MPARFRRRRALVEGPNGAQMSAGRSSRQLIRACHYFDTAARRTAEVADASRVRPPGMGGRRPHRDLSRNLLLSPDGRLRVNDVAWRGCSNTGGTIPGELRGQPAYPIFAGADHRGANAMGPPHDIYSLGATSMRG